MVEKEPNKFQLRQRIKCKINKIIENQQKMYLNIYSSSRDLPNLLLDKLLEKNPKRLLDNLKKLFLCVKI